MTRKDGGTAFPMQDSQAIHAYAQAATEAAKHDNVEDRDQTYLAARAEAVAGMTLRDYFAAKSIQGMLAALDAAGLNYSNPTMMSEHAYAMADAMLAARSA